MTVLFRLLGHLPLFVLHGMGALAGWIAYLGSPTYRRHMRENLALAYSAKEVKAILPGAVAHAGRCVLELPCIWMRSKEDVIGMVRQVTGRESLEAAQHLGEGIIFFTPHLGCFDIVAQHYASFAPVTVLYRPPKQGWLRPLMEEGRAGPNLHLAPTDLSGVRKLLRALKRREAVGMLPDQVPGVGEGIWAPFFGRPAYTMSLAARLTESTRASIIMIYAERLPHGEGFNIHMSAPSEQITGTHEERIKLLNRAIEELIRRCPKQYLWGYNRYKEIAGSRLPAPAKPAARTGD